MIWPILVVIFVRTLTDISFKKAVHGLTFDSLSAVAKNFWMLKNNIYWWSGLFFGLLNVVFWVLCLKNMDLSYAYPFLSLSYVTIILAGKLLFKERLDLPKWMGMGFIVVGAVLLFLG